MIILTLWVVVFLAAAWLYLRQVYSSFARQGIKYKKPIPFIGNMGRILLRHDHYTDHINDLYFAFPEERFVGRYVFMTEMIIIRDTELLKRVAVKDFEYFIDHRSLITSSESFLARNLLSLKGHEWKDMRSTLSPAFTSSKIRLMVPFIVDVGDQMIRSLKQKIKNGNVDYIDIDCKDLTTRYANDVIASCAFGLNVDSHSDENNEFYSIGKKTTLSTFNFRMMLMIFLSINFPALIKLLNWDFMTKHSKAFFKSLVLDNMKDREERNIIRPDMIHLLMEARKGQLTHEDVKSNDVAAGFATVDESHVGTKKVNRIWSDNDLVAQAVLFFIAGFETVSSSMSFLLYELAVNPEVQEKLAQEIMDHNNKNGGKINFNSIQSMTYMDMVVSEILRLWPPGVALERMCVKDYNLGKPNDQSEKDVIVRKGMSIVIPAFSFHRDPKFFPNPDKFDPERFSEENKNKIQTSSYIPFGIGPRNCIGSRFALCEIKVMAYQILQHFELSPCERTSIPAKLSPETFNIKLVGGHWLRFRVRS